MQTENNTYYTRAEYDSVGKYAGMVPKTLRRLVIKSKFITIGASLFEYHFSIMYESMARHHSSYDYIKYHKPLFILC